MIMNRTFATILLLSPGLLLPGCTTPSQNMLPSDSSSPESTLDLLVGVYTGSGSSGIYQLQFDPLTGRLADSLLLAETSNPSYLAISRDRQYVYSVNEDDPGSVTSFRWSHQDDTLVKVSSVSTQGAHPCFVALSHNEKQLAVANYTSGNLAVYSLGDHGVIQTAPQSRQHHGSGPVAPNQKGPHAHCSLFKDGFLYVVDLGADRIFSYPVTEGGQLGEAREALALSPGDGPRHLVFHPTQPLAFVVNELSSSVVSLSADLKNGSLTPISKLSTLPEGFSGQNFDADIHLTSDGKFLYVTNRGHNSLAIFSVAEKGSIVAVGQESTRGSWPRNFTFSPDEDFLLVANQESGNIVVFRRDSITGLLAFSGHEFTLSKPVCLKF